MQNAPVDRLAAQTAMLQFGQRMHTPLLRRHPGHPSVDSVSDAMTESTLGVRGGGDRAGGGAGAAHRARIARFPYPAVRGSCQVRARSCAAFTSAGTVRV